MQKHFFSKVWTEQKSLALTSNLTIVIAALCVIATLKGYDIVTWVVQNRTLNITGPAVGMALLVIGYLCAALAFWMLYNLHSFLYRLQKGQVFVAQNTTALRRISWCCAMASILCFGASIIYLPYSFIGVAAGFMALIVRVVKNAFEQAIKMKDELDFTV